MGSFVDVVMNAEGTSGYLLEGMQIAEFLFSTLGTYAYNN